MNLSLTHQHRSYRDRIIARDLLSFRVAIQETDLLILAETPLVEEARQSVINYRYQIEEYIRQHPSFLHAFSPLPLDAHAPPLIREMMRAAMAAAVGPMAAVAGAFAQQVGQELLQHSKQVVVENGGDIYMKVSDEILVGIFAGASPLSNKLAVRIPGEKTPLGVCTSSGTVGHSFSFGRSDAVTILSPSAFVADAAATAVGNCVKAKDDIQLGLDRAREIEGVIGAVIIADDHFGAFGEVELVSL